MRAAKVAAVALMLATSAIAVTARAGDDDPPEACFPTVGCVSERLLSQLELVNLSCGDLWTVRNGIYASRRYCFKTRRGAEEFGTAYCRYENEADVPLTETERANVRLLRAVEQQRGC